MPKRFKKVYIEISNVCNLQCAFCPPVERDKRFMDPVLFKKVAAAIAPLTDQVCFHLMGEPLLHPELGSYVDFCGALGLRINLTTNGLLLDDKRATILLRQGMWRVSFSLQSFEANFPGKDDSSYLRTIFEFTERAIRERPDLYIHYRLWNEGAPGAAESNRRMIDKIRQGLKVDFNPRWDVRTKKRASIKNLVSLHMDSRFEWPNPQHAVRSTQGFCHGLSSHIGILADGTVVPCCLDKEGVIRLGNCGSQNIEDIIQSPRATAIRNGFQKGILVEDLCQKCTFISRFDRKSKQLAGIK